MNATCIQCGNEVSWHAGRGQRLADHRCPSCGGRLSGMTAGRESKMRGETYGWCAVCGRRRASSKLITVNDEIARRLIVPPAVKPGDTICWYHECVCPLRSGDEHHLYVSARLLLSPIPAREHPGVCPVCRAHT